MTTDDDDFEDDWDVDDDDYDVLGCCDNCGESLCLDNAPIDDGTWLCDQCLGLLEKLFIDLSPPATQGDLR